MKPSAMMLFILMLLLKSVAHMLSEDPKCNPAVISEDPRYSSYVDTALRVLQTVTPTLQGHSFTFNAERSAAIVTVGRAACFTATQIECSSCLARAVNTIKDKCGNSKVASVVGKRCNISYEPPQV